MFESLKSKLKKTFSKSSDVLDADKIYEDTPKVEERTQPVVETTPVEKKTEEVSEPTPAVQEPVVEEKKLSRKEMLKAQKQKKETPSANHSDMFSDSTMAKKIKDDPLDDLLDELEVILLESDVAYPVVEQVILGVRENLIGRKYSREYTLDEVVEIALKDSIKKILAINTFDFDAWIEEQEKPVIIMFVGINGTGKTTAIAKIAKRLRDEGKSVVLASCDTFRAGAIEQLTIHADKLGVKIVKQTQDADPAAVAYDAVEHARSKKKDVVLIDTAGRMQTNNNLIEEMKKITRIAKPALKIFVGDSLAGNDAIEQAKAFNDAVGIDAIILTKIDTDAKGGAALSIAHTIGKPIAFVCNGQEYEDIEKFDADWMIDRMFD